ncbi:unnamed protein product [Ostreobium quekettii]|uniref:Uncharacterized protein n=1 Tax=Ostreobium quekettii TaxID=121088 RepID=A0A8S1JBJ7_9CHLO|nr:unnamed protein product [Ostreobium quekettii]
MGFGCPCAHEADCPCHPDDSWLKAGVCPKCPVFGCLECDPLKCDECKMCEPGAILSTDRKTCSCASCEVTGCAECDAEECDRCLVCGQGYELTVDRKCDWSECLVEHCEKCDPLNRYKCDTCNPFLVLSSDRKSCGCPECAIAGCEKCDPQKCDECLVCAGNEVPSADRSACGCECSISHCAVCGKDCDTCDKCDYGYEVFGDGAGCKCDRCEVPHCKECDPEDCLSCWACDAGYTFPAPVLSQRDSQDFAEYPPDHPGSSSDIAENSRVLAGYSRNFFEDSLDSYAVAGSCVCDGCAAPHCAACDPSNCSRCATCDVGFRMDKAGSCTCERCAVDRCMACDPHDCATCTACDPGFDLASDGSTCSCGDCAIPHCKTCDADDCGSCLECEDGYAAEYGAGCVCSACQVAHCQKCDSGNCAECAICEEGYSTSSDGLTCACDSCRSPNCDACADDCDICTACADGYVLEGSTCICGACGVAGCEECDPEDCGRCKKCVEGMEPDREGVCRCAGCGVDYCAQCSSTQCGVCEECAVYHELGWGGKSCECNCRSIVGCKEGACDENCRCNECYPPLQTSSCGYCLLGQSEPGCDWMWVDAKDDLSCADTCARRGANFPAAVNAAQEVNGPVNASVNASAVYPCFADIKGQEGIRPGQNIEEHTSSKAICNTEYNSQGLSGVWSDYRSKNSTSFFCVCQTESMPLRWVSKKVGQSTSQRVGQLTESEADGCREVCGTQGLFPIAFPGSHAHSRGRKMEFAVCRVKDSEHGTRERYSAKYYEGGVHAAMYSAGYNVQSEVWAGLCMTPTTFSKQYDCLCANDCHEADCGDVDRWSLGMDRSQIHG